MTHTIPDRTVRVGIIGGAGYTGGELIRLLINHPHAAIRFVHSESNFGNRITDIHDGLIGETDLLFTNDLPFDEVDVIFLCMGHGKSKEFITRHNIPERVRIIDLSQDFRLTSTPPEHDFVYGLPETNRELIHTSRHIANPGCFATCIQLSLIPLALHGKLRGDISVNAITGSTGAGAHPSQTTHFSWRSGNISVYKPFCHQHIPEIMQSLRACQTSQEPWTLDFIPYRGDFTRGIFATVVMRMQEEESQVIQWYNDFYHDAPFTHCTSRAIDLKQVLNTNKCLINIHRHHDKLLITSAIDNLIKGASGQAVQNMNIMFDLYETEALRLKPQAF